MDYLPTPLSLKIRLLFPQAMEDCDLKTLAILSTLRHSGGMEASLSSRSILKIRPVALPVVCQASVISQNPVMDWAVN